MLLLCMILFVGFGKKCCKLLICLSVFYLVEYDKLKVNIEYLKEDLSFAFAKVRKI